MADRAEIAAAAPARAHGRTRGHRNTTLSGDTRVDWSEAFALVPIPHRRLRLARRRPWRRGGRGSGADRLRDRGPGDLGQGPLRHGPLLVPLEPRAVLGRAAEGREGGVPGSRDQATIWRAPSPEDDHGRARPNASRITRRRSRCCSSRPRSAITSSRVRRCTTRSSAQGRRSSPPSVMAPAASDLSSTRCISTSSCGASNGSAG